ncbi:MAG TPA: hypothetical protein PK776_02015 [Flavobacterium sp.]|jgi:hypothetical protein|nr:hypothetical protein [Flavobacterium sp.]
MKVKLMVALAVISTQFSFGQEISKETVSNNAEAHLSQSLDDLKKIKEEKERLEKAKLKEHELALKEAEKQRKTAEKEQKRLAKELQKAEKVKKDIEKAQKNVHKATERLADSQKDLDKQAAKYKTLKDKDKLTPEDDIKWKKKLLKLTNKNKERKIELQEAQLNLKNLNPNA